jgi:hypothetical protein
MPVLLMMLFSGKKAKLQFQDCCLQAQSYQDFQVTRSQIKGSLLYLSILVVIFSYFIILLHPQLCSMLFRTLFRIILNDMLA